VAPSQRSESKGVQGELNFDTAQALVSSERKALGKPQQNKLEKLEKAVQKAYERAGTGHWSVKPEDYPNAVQAYVKGVKELFPR
jgi:hypothetical protein